MANPAPDLDPQVYDIERLVKSIVPKLKGQPHEVQAGALADLFAMFLAGHPDFIRETVIELHLDAVRGLVEVNERILFGPNGHPQNRSQKEETKQ